MADEPKPIKSTKTVMTTVAHEPAAPQHLPPAPHLMEEEGGVGRYIWNGDKHEFLGRTCASWLFITVFYLIFFFCLFCFFVISWYISLSFLHVDAPYRFGKGAILGHSGPGLSGRPIPDRENNGVSTLLWFKTGTYADYHFWSEQLVSWFNHIPETGSKNVKTCFETGKVGTKIFLKEVKKATDESCLIEPKWYGPCKGEDPTFGYDRAEPCILFKMNRIYGFIPKPFTMEEWKKAGEGGNVKIENGESIPVPKALVKYITSLGSAGGGGSTGGGGSGGSRTGGDGTSGGGTGGDGTGGDGTSGGGTGGDGSRKKRQAAPEAPAAPEGGNGTDGGGAGRNAGEDVTIQASEIPSLIEKYIMVWCDGENEHDKEALGSLEYFPGPYIPAAFFPFKSQKNYQTPFIMVQLKRPVPGAMISIVCQAYAKNINLDKESGVGYARFQVLAG